MEKTLYPSLEDFASLSPVYSELIREFSEGRQVHAYLFLGPGGIGKKTFSNRLGQILFCSGEKKPCGLCGGCTRFLHGVHQDVMTVDDEKLLTVDVIRSMIEEIGTATYEGGSRAVFLPHADRMNPAAQNSLLKTLEEPPRGTVFFLMAEDERKLLPTIVSRCRIIRMSPLSHEQTVEALRHYEVDDVERNAILSRGIVGQALEIAGNSKYIAHRQTVIENVFRLNNKAFLSQSVNNLVPARKAKESKKTNGEKKKNGEAALSADEVLDITEDILHRLMLSCVLREELPEELPERWTSNAVPARLPVFRRLLEAVMGARRIMASQVNPQAAVEQLLYTILEETETW